jgi:Ser-tRNA(Ala) deacylase AlaX
MTYMKYLEDTEMFAARARVSSFEPAVGMSQAILTLDETIFYPQGGGQPTDTGTVTGQSATMNVERVSYREGDIFHSGGTVGSFIPGEEVALEVDPERRMRHAKLHTGGHLVMTAVDRLIKLPAAKGYHFPDGPYVEFIGTTDPNTREQLLASLQVELDSLVAEDSNVTSEFVTPEELRAQEVYVPAEIPAGKPTRVVITSGYKSPCGGTHVKRLGALTGLRVRGIKTKSGHTRISYFIEGV